jgi:N-acetylglucosamine-6-sulfatase
MSRRPPACRPLAAAFALFALLIVAALATAQNAAAAQPNIVLVLADDQRWDTLRYMPTVSRELVGRGVTFSNAFVVNPLCCPSRASILTGQYSHTTRVYRNNGPYAYEAFDDRESIATWLDAAGYTTAYIGKYLNGYDLERVPPGWDHWVGYRGGYYAYRLNVDGVVQQRGTAASDYSTDVLRDHALSFIDRHAARPAPLFIVLAPYAPHLPPVPAPRHENAFAQLARKRPPSYNEPDIADKPRWLRLHPTLVRRNDRGVDRIRRNQLATLLAVDDAIGAIVDKLEATGRLRDTLIVYTSDNGLLWGEHRLPGWKIVPYEESIRVPLVMRYDGLVQAPRTEERLVTNIDLAPTFAELGGATPAVVDGRSVVPLIAERDASWRDAFLIEHLVEPDATRKGSLVPTYCAVRTARWKYVAYSTREEELYHVSRDRYELENRASDASFRRKLLAMRARLKAHCVPPPPGFGTDWICTIEPSGSSPELIGTDSSDTICGTARRERLYGRAGSDIIRARGGDDVVRGADGDDRVIGGPGRDRVSGGPGDDTMRVRDATTDTIGCGPGIDVVLADTNDLPADDCEDVRRP